MTVIQIVQEGFYTAVFQSLQRVSIVLTYCMQLKSEILACD